MTQGTRPRSGTGCTYLPVGGYDETTVADEGMSQMQISLVW